MDVFNYLKQKEREIFGESVIFKLRQDSSSFSEIISNSITNNFNNHWFSRFNQTDEDSIHLIPGEELLACPKAKTFYNEWKDRIGNETYLGDWFLVDQECIDQFAEATGDQQWIHVDVGRARKESPFRTTIAHGYLILSLLPRISGTTNSENATYSGARLIVNSGLNKAEFLYPVKVNTRIRARISLKSLTPQKRSIILVNTIEIELEKPNRLVCLAETVIKLYF